MGLIIKDKLQELMKGYPTVSDKYNIAGAVLEGDYAVGFGELVQFGTTKGYFEAINASNPISAITDVAGFTLATNVKLAENWPGTTVQINPGEAFNLVVNGFLAVELDSGATTSYITPNAGVAVIFASGKLTTSDKVSSTTIELLPNVVFTGVTEVVNGVRYAEIYVK